MDRTLQEIEDWIIAQLSRLLGVAPHQIGSHQPLSRYGLDSIIAAELTADLEDWLHRPVPVTLLEDEQTIEAIARSLSGAKEATASSSSSRSSVNGASKIERPERLTSSHISHGKERLNGAFSGTLEPIAIVGLGSRLPGAGHPEAFWHLLRNKIEALVEV